MVKPGRTLFLILPHGGRTFDRGRTLTQLEHHIEDYGNKVIASDTSHHDKFEKFFIRQLDHHWLSEAKKEDGDYDFEYIVKNGHMHYHVWTQNEMIDILEYIGVEILMVIDELPGRKDSFAVISKLPA